MTLCCLLFIILSGFGSRVRYNLSHFACNVAGDQMLLERLDTVNLVYRGLRLRKSLL